ncbi:MAG: poly-gamma-glutamate biosynthesis protein PgsC/CapC [Ardenticatenaceae bacterium]
MHEYIFDTELVRLSILVGVVISLLVYNRYGVTTGGTVVPGYLALFVLQPTQILSTLALATATYVLVHKQLRPRFMLWGRKLFESEILVALFLQILWIGVLIFLIPQTPEVTLLYGIGFLLPGIIAHDMGRQGVSNTLLATVGCAVAVFSLVTIVGSVRDSFALPISMTGSGTETLTSFAYSGDLLLVGVGISVLASIFLYHRSHFFESLRTGGFITAAYLGLVLNRPLDLLFIVICSALTYLIVTKILMKQAILFGRTKVAAMVLMGMIVTWSAELLLWYGMQYVPWAGFNAIAPMIIALLANDAQRQGPKRTLIGATSATLIVFCVLYWF